MCAGAIPIELFYESYKTKHPEADFTIGKNGNYQTMTFNSGPLDELYFPKQPQNGAVRGYVLGGSTASENLLEAQCYEKGAKVKTQTCYKSGDGDVALRCLVTLNEKTTLTLIQNKWTLIK